MADMSFIKNREYEEYVGKWNKVRARVERTLDQYRELRNVKAWDGHIAMFSDLISQSEDSLQTEALMEGMTALSQKRNGMVNEIVERELASGATE